MSTINTRKVGDSFYPTTIENESRLDDPFSEYVHRDDRVITEQYVESNQQVPQTQLRPKEELFQNIDRLFDGANLVFDIADRVMKNFQRRR